MNDQSVRRIMAGLIFMFMLAALVVDDLLGAPFKTDHHNTTTENILGLAYLVGMIASFVVAIDD